MRGESIIHLPAAIAGEFGISRSQARQLISQGHVRVNDRVVSDLDVDLATIRGDLIELRIDGPYARDAIMELLAEQADVLLREVPDDDDVSRPGQSPCGRWGACPPGGCHSPACWTQGQDEG